MSERKITPPISRAQKRRRAGVQTTVTGVQVSVIHQSSLSTASDPNALLSVLLSEEAANKLNAHDAALLLNSPELLLMAARNVERKANLECLKMQKEARRKGIEQDYSRFYIT